MRMPQRLQLFGLIFPTYTWLTVAVLIPIFVMLVFSFLSDVPLGQREPRFTLENYGRFLSRPVYLRLTLKAIQMGLLVTVGGLVVGYPVAYGLARVVPGRWRAGLFLLVIVPFWSSSLIRAYSWVIVLGENGVINQLLKALRLPSPGLSILFSFPAIIVGLIHAYVPYVVLTIYVSLDNIDDSLIEAAQSLGANRFQAFLQVVLPLSLPGVIAGGVLTFIPATGSFMEPRVLGGVAGTVIGTIIEDQFISVFNWPFGAALAFVVLAISASILLIFSGLLKMSGVLSGGMEL